MVSSIDPASGGLGFTEEEADSRVVGPELISRRDSRSTAANAQDLHVEVVSANLHARLRALSRSRFPALPTPRFVWHKGGVKSLTEQLWFEVPNRRGFVNITPTVENLVRKSGVQEGLCLVNAMHITASVFINDAEDGLLHDYDVWLEKLAPHAPTSQYQHNRTGEDNADAHMKRQIMGREVVVAITKGKLDFGPWEQIFYGEFDGRRRKRALVKIIGE
jgi:secondary thiamine-phosphate synthase enzyme